jgi:hypothetical protein
MRKSLVAAAVLLLSSSVGNAQQKQPVHVVIHAAPQQIKKAALAMFARNGYSLDSETASQLKISKPVSSEETDAYNTAHWTTPPSQIAAASTRFCCRLRITQSAYRCSPRPCAIPTEGGVCSGARTKKIFSRCKTIWLASRPKLRELIRGIDTIPRPG